MKTHIQNIVIAALAPHERKHGRIHLKTMTDIEIAAKYLCCPCCQKKGATDEEAAYIPLSKAVDLAQDASDWSGWMALCKREQEKNEKT
jgi:hypothetical protein